MTKMICQLALVACTLAALIGCGNTTSGGNLVDGEFDGAEIRSLSAEQPDTDTEDTDTEQTTCYRDRDADGFGGTEKVMVDGFTCGNEPGVVPNNDDCDDTRYDVRPGAPELADNVDNDCDGAIDDGIEEPTSQCYIDSDRDGYGRSTRTTVQGNTCNLDGYSDRDGDCNDGQPGIRPGANEVSNGIDDDCDGSVDEDTQTEEAWCYDDEDDDGYGGEGSVRRQYAGDTCPSGTSENNDDCDDNESDANPDADEDCDDNIDNDCDGDTDEDDSECDPDQEDITCWTDADGDGYGDEDASQRTFTVDLGDDCNDVGGSYADNNDDCDDNDDSIHSGCGAVNPGNGTIEFCWNGAGIDDVDISRMQLVVFNEGDNGDDGAAESVIQTSGLNNASDCIETTQTYSVGDVACVNVTFTHSDPGVPVYDGDEWFLAGCDGEPCDPIVTGIPSINGEQPSLNNVYSDEYRTSGSRLSYAGISEDSTPTAGRWFFATNWNGQGVDLCVVMTDTLF